MVEKMIENKKAQVTIFVIIAVLIIAAIALIFFFNNNPKIQDMDPATNPQAYIRECFEKDVKETITKMLSQSGYVFPEDQQYSLLYNQTQIAFLCYSENEIENCINLEPALVSHFEKEVSSNTFGKLENCFSSLQRTLDKYGYNSESTEFSIDISPEQARMDIKKKITIGYGEDSRSFETFDFTFSSPAYKMLSLANTILNEEALSDCSISNGNADIILLQGKNLDLEL